MTQDPGRGRRADPRAAATPQKQVLCSGESTKKRQKAGHKNGVTILHDPTKQNDVPATIGLERNILGVPLCVLNQKAASMVDKLSYKWPLEGGRFASYAFTRPSDGAFPIPEHVLYIDCLMALFAANFNRDGRIYYRRTDVLRLAGKNANNRAARKSFDEAVLRFRRCNMEWKFAWHGNTEDWASPLIIYTNLWDEPETPRNPRNHRSPIGDGESRKEQEKWHCVQFNPFIVKALESSKTRIFLTEVLRSEVKADSFSVYRYFFGFSDTSEVRRTYDQLMTVFPWLGRISRFKPWLKERLDELHTLGFIEYYKMYDDGVAVKSYPIKDLKASLKGKGPVILPNSDMRPDDFKPQRRSDIDVSDDELATYDLNPVVKPKEKAPERKKVRPKEESALILKRLQECSAPQLASVYDRLIEQEQIPADYIELLEFMRPKLYSEAIATQFVNILVNHNIVTAANWQQFVDA